MADPPLRGGAEPDDPRLGGGVACDPPDPEPARSDLREPDPDEDPPLDPCEPEPEPALDDEPDLVVERGGGALSDPRLRGGGAVPARDELPCPLSPRVTVVDPSGPRRTVCDQAAGMLPESPYLAMIFSA